MRGRWVLGLGIVGCSGPDELRACDEGTPTCESSLVIALPDPRVEFTVRAKDELGLDIEVDCPIPAGGTEDLGDYSVICGSGRLTVSTFLYFGQALEVQLEEGPWDTFAPEYQKGADFCGNACTTGTVQL